jgi:hypothetical protein
VCSLPSILRFLNNCIISNKAKKVSKIYFGGYDILNEIPIFTESPANLLEVAMWGFLHDQSQKENIAELKQSVYRLINMTIQKTAGNQGNSGNNKKDISWNTVDHELMNIVIEAAALVLSGRLDELK